MRGDNRGQALVGIDDTLRPGDVAGVGVELDGDVQHLVSAGVEVAVRIQARKRFDRGRRRGVHRRRAAKPALARVARVVVEILGPLGWIFFLIPVVIVVIADDRQIRNVRVIQDAPRVAGALKFLLHVVIDRIDRVDVGRPADHRHPRGRILRDDVAGIGRRDLVCRRIGRERIPILHFIAHAEDKADILGRRVADDPIHLAVVILVGLPLDDRVILRIRHDDEGELAGALVECQRR